MTDSRNKMSQDKFTVPEVHGEVFVWPGAGEIKKGVSDNIKLLENSAIEFMGESLSQWRQRSRVELLGKAWEYAKRLELNRADSISSDGALIVTGHQCCFYHCGILAKYILASCLADVDGGRVLNLVVDNDLPGEITFNVPLQDGDGLEVRRLSPGVVNPELPMEYQQLPNAQKFQAFVKELASIKAAGGARGELGYLAGIAEESYRQAANLAEWFTLFNHKAAQRLGLDWLELPVSVMAETSVFMDFVGGMLSCVAKLHLCYNDAIDDFCRVNKDGLSVRLTKLADGQDNDGFLEMPFWVFREGHGRCRLLVKAEDGYLFLRDEVGEIGQIKAGAGGGALGDLLQERGFHLRPRAVTLTVFARLFLGDLFVHGTGGARYDWVTDNFIRRFFGFAPPLFACGSATLRLVQAEQAGVADAVEQLRTARCDDRDIRYNPQRYVSDNVDAELQEVIARRWQVIGQSRQLKKVKGNRQLRQELFEEIHRLNKMIVAGLGDTPKELAGKVAEARRRLNNAEDSCSREYFFGLFSRQQLDKLDASIKDFM